MGSSAAGDPAAVLEPVSPPRGRSGCLKGVTFAGAPRKPVGGGPQGGPPEKVLVKPTGVVDGAAPPGVSTPHLIPIANRVLHQAKLQPKPK